jgi:hypothetical protein
MKSLLYQPGQILKSPPTCKPCRDEVVTSFQRDGRTYTLTMRNKVVVEDPYIVLIKAAAFAISQQEPFSGRIVPREIRDTLIKTNTVRL